MNIFEKIKSISSSISLIVIPIIILFVGNEYTESIKEREIQGRFVELSINILKEEPSKENKSLREWAIRTINKYSGIPLSKTESEDLIQKIPIPLSSIKYDKIKLSTVVSIQEYLKEFGYYNGPINGVIDSAGFKKSIMRFQIDHGLKPDGELSRSTSLAIQQKVIKNFINKSK